MILSKRGIKARKTTIKNGKSNFRPSSWNIEKWFDLKGVLFHGRHTPKSNSKSFYSWSRPVENSHVGSFASFCLLIYFTFAEISCKIRGSKQVCCGWVLRWFVEIHRLKIKFGSYSKAKKWNHFKLIFVPLLIVWNDNSNASSYKGIFSVSNSVNKTVD